MGASPESTSYEVPFKPGQHGLEGYGLIDVLFRRSVRTQFGLGPFAGVKSGY